MTLCVCTLSVAVLVVEMAVKGIAGVIVAVMICCDVVKSGEKNLDVND